jgi:hypothetical protein
MSNLKLGFYSSIIATILTTIFALSMVLGNNSLSFGSCMILSWSYVTLTCAFVTNVSNGKKSLGYAGVIFAAIYSAFITLVYYTQLTTVNQNAASNEILRVLRFEPGSWMFAFDLMGYAMMAISTFFIGVSLDAKTRAYKWLKGLLIAHGLFAPMCIIFPMINVFQNTQNVENTSIIGMIGLVGWCVYFIPTMVLAAIYFYRESKIFRG